MLFLPTSQEARDLVLISEAVDWALPTHAWNRNAAIRALWGVANTFGDRRMQQALSRYEHGCVPEYN